MQMVDVDVLQDFKEHTFRVAEDPEMDELKESIRENGVVEPILIFVNEDGGDDRSKNSDDDQELNDAGSFAFHSKTSYSSVWFYFTAATPETQQIV